MSYLNFLISYRHSSFQIHKSNKLILVHCYLYFAALFSLSHNSQHFELNQSHSS